MWRSRVSWASLARRALPGEATRLAVVAVRARVVADGLLFGLPGKAASDGVAPPRLCNRGVVRLTLNCRTGAGLQAMRIARNEEVAKPKFYLL